MHVMIVDDLRVNVRLLARLVLAIPNVEITTFTSPDDALAWSLDHDVDLAIVDFNMPTMTGADFIARFRMNMHNHDTPVVIVTAERALAVRHQCLQAGATDFLCKPIDHIGVTARVSNLLTLRQAQLDLPDRAKWLSRESDKATAELVAREKELIRCFALAAEYHDTTAGEIIDASGGGIHAETAARR